jgi:hypothetical protein
MLTYEQALTNALVAAILSGFFGVVGALGGQYLAARNAREKEQWDKNAKMSEAAGARYVGPNLSFLYSR